MMNTGDDPQNALKTSLRLTNEMFNSFEARKSNPSKSLTGWVGENDQKVRNSSPFLLSQIVYSGIEVALSMAEHNASMGKIVACPTAGACGVVPGALISIHKNLGKSVEELSHSLLVAGAVGGENKEKRIDLSGAVVGCQARNRNGDCHWRRLQ